MTKQIENKITNAADSVEPSAEFSQNLWAQIRMTPRKENAPKRISRFVWIPAVTVLGILVVMVFVTPQTVLAAFKNLLSYIPGIGFVQKDETTLYLEKPVLVEQNGYTFTLDQVVADKNKVVVAYHMVSPSSNFYNCSYDGNYLVWLNGRSNNPIGGGNSSTPEGSISGQIQYFPLPDGDTQASLKVSFDPGSTVGCTAPKEWIIPFTLGTEIPDIEIFPVVENSTAQVTPSFTASSDTSSLSTTTDKSVQFIVDKYVELNDGYLLTGHIENHEKSWRSVSIDMMTLFAQDANGNKVTIEPTTESLNDNEFALKVVGKNFTAPLTIQVQKLLVMASEEEAPSFFFDAGSNPQIDQKWDINQGLEIAGEKIFVKEIKVIEDTTKTNYPTSVMGYDISASSTNDIDVSFDCSGKEKSSSSWNQSMPGNGNEFSVENYYPDGIPNGVVTCKIWNAFFQASGNWKFQWHPSPTTN
jgi:hypothetical protein